MKRKETRLLALLLSSMMIISVAGCGDTKTQEESKTEESKTEESKTEESTPESETEEEAFAWPLEEQVTLTLALKENVNFTFENNSYLEELEEYTNVKLDITVIPTDVWAERIPLMFSDGSYPDIFLNGGFTDADLEQFGVNEGFFIPIGDMLREYAPNVTELLDANPIWWECIERTDGNIYGIPYKEDGGNSHGNCSYKLYMNQDWLDALDMEQPTTTEEFRSVLEAFKTQDPNGNGKADEIPLTGAIGTWAADVYLYLLNAFGYYDGTAVYYRDGEQFATFRQDYLKEGLTYIHELYEDGLIDQAALTQDGNQLTALARSEEVIVGAVTCGHIGMFNTSLPFRPVSPLEGPDGYREIPYSLNGGVLSGASFVVTDKCENPEIAVRFADLLADEYWVVRTTGELGVDFDYAEEGELNLYGEQAWVKKLPYAREGETRPFTYGVGNSLSHLQPAWKTLHALNGDIYASENYESRIWYDTFTYYEPYASSVDLVYGLNYGDDQEEYTTIDTAVKDAGKSAIVEFIMGIRDIETEWDDFQAELDQIGYGRMLEIHKAAYDAKFK